MRRLALLGLTLTLSGCGYNTWSNPPFTTGSNPNAPPGNSDTMRRVMGEPVEAKPLEPQAGDVWPGPLPPSPTLQDLEKQTNTLGAVPQGSTSPGSPNYREGNPLLAPVPSPSPSQGSSVPPPQNQRGVTALPQLPSVPNGPRAPAAPPPQREPGGRVIQTPGGPVVTGGGTQGYQTTTTPGGGSAIVVPNGNGTSTIIYSDGRIETVPTPK
jgi:hypothetical protein